MRTLAIVLVGNNTQSQVVLDGLDISSMVRGLEITAFIGQPTLVTLHLIANCELMADVPDVATTRPGEDPHA